MEEEKEKTFLQELTELINKHSFEGLSDTPDYIIARYLYDCLIVLGATVTERDKWYNSKQ